MSTPAPDAAHVLGMLANFGVKADDLDGAVIAAALQQYEAGIEMLLEADFSGMAVEADCDPSEPPA